MRLSQEARTQIAQQLKAARLEKKLTKIELARELGVSRQMIYRYEEGLDAPSAQNLAKALRYLGVSVIVQGHKLTAEAFEIRGKGPIPPGEQIDLPLGVPQEFSGTTIRVTRNEGSIEIHALISSTTRR